MPGLLETMIDLDERLSAADLPHAFGGAMALMWCTGEPRTTKDIDLNVFTGAEGIDAVLELLPPGVKVSAADRAALEATGQRRLFYDELPIDLFFNTTGFHRDVEIHTTHHVLGGRALPFLGCNDLAVFKAFFNRRKDWADIEEMLRADQVDVAYVIGIITSFLGTGDPRLRQLLEIRDELDDERSSFHLN